jgi:hypothetical protein
MLIQIKVAGVRAEDAWLLEQKPAGNKDMMVRCWPADVDQDQSMGRRLEPTIQDVVGHRKIMSAVGGMDQLAPPPPQPRALDALIGGDVWRSRFQSG